MFNSSMLVAAVINESIDDELINDIITFIRMNKPSMVEVDKSIAEIIRHPFDE